MEIIERLLDNNDIKKLRLYFAVLDKKSQEGGVWEKYCKKQRKKLRTEVRKRRIVVKL